jgi:hypothetical protein
MSREQDMVEYHLTHYDTLFSVKSQYHRHFQDVVDYVLPRSQSFEGTISPGAPIGTKLYDSTAVWANEQLASGLHSYMTNPSDRWFKLSLPESMAHLMEEEDVANWLQDTADRMYQVFNSQDSGFTAQSHELYLDLGAFGTAIMYAEEAWGKAPLRFSTFHLSEVVVEEDERGVVNTLYRKFKMTARNVLNLFGDAVPVSVAEKAQKKPYEKLELLHCVRPRHEWNPEVNAGKHLPFASIYILCEGKVLLKEGGYREFPFLVPRWSKLTGEVYGRGPSAVAMPDIRMVNAMSKTVINAAQKVVDPPLMVPDEGFMLPIRTAPGGLNFYNSTMNPENRITPLETRGNINLGLDMIKARQDAIVKSFYVDWMRLQEGPQMTATEVVQRSEDNMRLMAPSVTRLQTEFLNPLIDRVFNVMMRRGMLPEVPQSLRQGAPLIIEYVSPVARAQRMTQIMGFQRMLEGLGQVASQTGRTQAFDRLDDDKVTEMYAVAYDVDRKVLKPLDQVTQERKERQEQQAKEQEAALENAQMDTASKAGKAAQSAAQAAAIQQGAPA